MNQCHVILRHFKANKTLTAVQASSVYGITQLSARLGELEALGHRFNMETIRGFNRLGNPSRYGLYTYLGEGVTA